MCLLEHLISMFAILLFISGSFLCQSQSGQVSTYTEYVEVMPSYPGGETQLTTFLYSNLRYPDFSYEHHIEGRVIVAFTVMADGRADSIHVLRGVARDLDEEAIRVVKLLDRFKPGMRSGKPIPVRFTLPIRFKTDAAHPGSRMVMH